MATAKLSRRVKRPVYHLPISWRPEERLPKEVQIQVAEEEFQPRRKPRCEFAGADTAALHLFASAREHRAELAEHAVALEPELHPLAEICVSRPGVARILVAQPQQIVRQAAARAEPAINWFGWWH